jgi:hypothetical protein
MSYLSFALSFSIFIFAGCSSMKPNYKMCKETNWRESGMKDGKKDLALEETFDGYNLLCRNFEDKELKPDLTMYRFGHATGVKELCTFDNGRKYGLDRKNTSINCNLKSHKEFYRGIKVGIKEYCKYESGYNHGLAGQKISKICKTTTHKDFYKGVFKGIRDYCTFESGKKMGAIGKTYTGACNQKGEAEFVKGYTIGSTQSEVKKLSKEITNLKVENSKLTERIRGLENENLNLTLRKQVLQNRVFELEGMLGN